MCERERERCEEGGNEIYGDKDKFKCRARDKRSELAISEKG